MRRDSRVPAHRDGAAAVQPRQSFAAATARPPLHRQRFGASAYQSAAEGRTSASTSGHEIQGTVRVTVLGREGPRQRLYYLNALEHTHDVQHITTG